MFFYLCKFVKYAKKSSKKSFRCKFNEYYFEIFAEEMDINNFKNYFKISNIWLDSIITGIEDSRLTKDDKNKFLIMIDEILFYELKTITKFFVWLPRQMKLILGSSKYSLEEKYKYINAYDKRINILIEFLNENELIKKYLGEFPRTSAIMDKIDKKIDEYEKIISKFEKRVNNTIEKKHTIKNRNNIFVKGAFSSLGTVGILLVFIMTYGKITDNHFEYIRTHINNELINQILDEGILEDFHLYLSALIASITYYSWLYC